MTDVETAKSIISDLAVKRDEALSSLSKIEERRADLSYAAHVTGGEAAKSLSRANAERQSLVLKIEELEHALSQAGERLAEAEQGEQAAALRGKAEEARRIIENRLATRGAAADAGFAQIRDALLGINEDMLALRRLGAPTPSDDLVDVNRRRAVDAALMGLGLKTSPVPPGLRVRFEDLVRSWSTPMLRWADMRTSTEAERSAA